MARSRFCIQAGLGPFFTPRTRRSAKPGQSALSAPSKSSMTLTGVSPSTLKEGAGLTLSVPMPDAARSRAMPKIEVQSGRLGVRLISMTGSSMP